MDSSADAILGGGMAMAICVCEKSANEAKLCVAIFICIHGLWRGFGIGVYDRVGHTCFENWACGRLWNEYHDVVDTTISCAVVLRRICVERP